MLKNFFRFVVTIAIIAGVIYGGYRWVMHTIETHSYVGVDDEATPEEYVRIDIESGMRAADILEILYEEELIRNEVIARLLVRFNRWGRIQIGQYYVYGGMSLEEMFELFGGGGEYLEICETHHCIIIPEGILITRIASIFGEALEIEPDDFLELWSDVDFLAELIEEYWFLTDEILNPELYYPLEGYIIPIRHEIPKDEDDLREMTRAMLSMTERIFGYNNIQNLSEEHDLTIHELLSFAAVIQGETGRIDQMNDVSGVFWNRLEIDMLWQSDVSAQYLLDERVVDVLYEHTDVESLFNTYHHAGIPIGPMNNPSASAIIAVMNPADHNYIFFITDMHGCAGEIGEKLFTDDYSVHTNNRNTYLNHHRDHGECP